MADTRFRPTVCPLEARDVPVSGVTPTQVFEATGFVQQTPPVLEYFERNLGLARAGGAGQALLGAADLNNGAAATLNNFIADTREIAATNPAAAGTLNGLAQGAAALVARATANAAAAEALANRLGVFRPVPFVPPTGEGDSNISPQPDQNPPGSTPVTPTPAPIPTDGTALSRTIPNTSDAGFVAAGTQGVRVRDVRVGEGAAATATGPVSVRYRGFLAADGTQFDTNVDNPETANTPLTATLGQTPRQLIPGFEQGLVGLRVGGIRDIFIPAAQGYAERGAGDDVPPNADLVFTVQLLSAS